MLLVENGLCLLSRVAQIITATCNKCKKRRL